MKAAEINAIFSAKVNEFLSAGYQINTNTMNGSQGEIAKIDFRKGDEVIRVMLRSETIWGDDFRTADAIILTVEPEQGFSVPVGVWKISDTDEKYLDRYEGFPRFYRKESLLVSIADEWEEAVVYVMNDGFPLQEPSAGYYTTVRQGYMDFNFRHDDFEKLWTAMDYARRNGVKR